jgi:RNA polymerase sigma-70 factor (ECF subfamily)
MTASEQHTDFFARQYPADLDDTILASLAAGGHTGAHTAIWDRYGPLVRSIMRRNIGPGSDVEDLVQEVFLRLYRNLTLLRNKGALRSFIFAISFRVAISELRSRRVRKWVRLTDDGRVQAPNARFAGPADFEAREAVAGLYTILDRLEAKDHMAFVLYYVEGLELTEVAAAVGVSLATIKRRLGRVSSRVFAMAESDRRLNEYLGKVAPCKAARASAKAQ